MTPMHASFGHEREFSLPQGILHQHFECCLYALHKMNAKCRGYTLPSTYQHDSSQKLIKVYIGPALTQNCLDFYLNQLLFYTYKHYNNFWF